MLVHEGTDVAAAAAGALVSCPNRFESVLSLHEHEEELRRVVESQTHAITRSLQLEAQQSVRQRQAGQERVLRAETERLRELNTLYTHQMPSLRRLRTHWRQLNERKMRLKAAAGHDAQQRQHLLQRLSESALERKRCALLRQRRRQQQQQAQPHLDALHERYRELCNEQRAAQSDNLTLVKKLRRLQTPNQRPTPSPAAAASDEDDDDENEEEPMRCRTQLQSRRRVCGRRRQSAAPPRHCRERRLRLALEHGRALRQRLEHAQHAVERIDAVRRHTQRQRAQTRAERLHAFVRACQLPLWRNAFRAFVADTWRWREALADALRCSSCKGLLQNPLLSLGACRHVRCRSCLAAAACSDCNSLRSERHFLPCRRLANVVLHVRRLQSAVERLQHALDDSLPRLQRSIAPNDD